MGVNRFPCRSELLPLLTVSSVTVPLPEPIRLDTAYYCIDAVVDEDGYIGAPTLLGLCTEEDEEEEYFDARVDLLHLSDGRMSRICLKGRTDSKLWSHPDVKVVHEDPRTGAYKVDYSDQIPGSMIIGDAARIVDGIELWESRTAQLIANRFPLDEFCFQL